MTDVDASKSMYELLRLIEQINKVAVTLPGIDGGVFEPISLEMPKLMPPELGCMRVVSWLFVQHFEAGRLGTSFLESKVPAYGHDSDRKVKRHRILIQQLRTLFQHNLNSCKEHDRGIVEACEQWFKSKCETSVPSSDEHWAKCLTALLQEAREALEILLLTLRSIEADESCTSICQEWQTRIKRYFPPYIFDEIIGKAAVDMGRDGIDEVALRKKNYDSWQKHMSLLQDGVDFTAEARKLVEHAILSLAPRVLPITGRDLMDEFDLGPGQIIGQLLKAAQQMHDIKPCSRDDILHRLRNEVLPTLVAD